MRAKAAITSGDGTFFIDEVEIGHPGDDEVLVQIKASGICHTDWDSLNWGQKIILGHEGAGIVLEKGKHVQHVEIGDHILLNWAISCGSCFQCSSGNFSLCENYSPVAGLDPMKGHAQPEACLYQGEPIGRSFNIGTLSSHSIVRKEAVISIDATIPFPSACIVGCGVMTGYGSVVNASNIKPGDSAVILGCGGVGLNVIQGARVAGAAKVIAIDIRPQRLEMARTFGATHTIHALQDDKDLAQAAAQVRKITNGRGADLAFECTGVPALGAAPLAMVRHAGMAVQVSGIEQDLTIDMNLFEWDKTYINPLYGKCNPNIDFSNIFELYQRGQLLLDELITKTYKLEQLSQAFEDMMMGRNAKGVVRFE